MPGFDELGLPPGVRRLADLHHGLVLVTGATGVGKTTTVASMIGHINRTRRQHIVTIEDPIEILHADERSIVNQREVGLDTASFDEALRRVLRQDPDVIVIGELRDSETAETALQAAESGHLVLSTMHTIDAAETVRRLVEFFPAIKQPQVRSILAGVLRGVVSQRLLPKIGGGRVAAVEVMVVNSRIEELIREDRAEEIPEAIADGQFFDMQTLSDGADRPRPRREPSSARPRRRPRPTSTTSCSRSSAPRRRGPPRRAVRRPRSPPPAASASLRACDWPHRPEAR